MQSATDAAKSDILLRRVLGKIPMAPPLEVSFAIVRHDQAF